MPLSALLHSNVVLLILSALFSPTTPETSPFCQAPVSCSHEKTEWALLGEILLHFLR